MPNFDSNHPEDFGWSYPATDIVPYSFAGHIFYNGMSLRAVPVFTRFFRILALYSGFTFHFGSGPGDGDWGYEDRDILSSGDRSFHAYGLAADVNAPWNPQGVRDPSPSPYRLPDATDQLALGLGLLWGGNHRFIGDWDRMHIENHNSPAELLALSGHAPAPVFPLPYGSWFGPSSSGPGAVSGYQSFARFAPDIRQIQREGGVPMDGLYGPGTWAATGRWQRQHGLVADGLVGPVTWAAMGL